MKMIRKFFFISVKAKFVTMNFFPSYEELGDIISTSQIVALKLFFLEPKYWYTGNVRFAKSTLLLGSTEDPGQNRSSLHVDCQWAH